MRMIDVVILIDRKREMRIIDVVTLIETDRQREREMRMIDAISIIDVTIKRTHVLLCTVILVMLIVQLHCVITSPTSTLLLLY